MRTAVTLILMAMSFALFAEEDGKVFVKSEPAGADLFLLVDNGDETTTEKALDKKTSALVQIPQGKHVLILKLAGFVNAKLEVDVKGTAILKPDVVKMEKPTADIDLVFEEGWQVFANKLPIKDKHGNPAVTPCTVTFVLGSIDIAFAKEGFSDISQKIDVKENGAVEVKGKTVKGTSKFLTVATPNVKTPKPAEASLAKDAKAVCSNIGWGSVDHILDGKIGDQMNGVFDIKPMAIKIDLGKAKTIAMMKLYPFKYSDGSVCNPSRIKVYGSQTDSAFDSFDEKDSYVQIEGFTDAVKKDDPTKGTEFRFKAPPTVRYLKIMISEVMQNNVGKRERGAVSEIELFGN